MRTLWNVNTTPAERIARVVVGLVGAVGGAFLLTTTPSALVATAEVLLILAGVDLLVTGATGHCPLYQRLGHLPRSLRRTP